MNVFFEFECLQVAPPHPRTGTKAFLSGSCALTLAFLVSGCATVAPSAQRPATVVTIDGQQGATTIATVRPPCQATIDSPAALTDANYDDYRLTGTCSANTFLSIDADSPTRYASVLPDAPCVAGKFVTPPVGAFDHIDPREVKYLVVAANDRYGRCTQTSRIPVRYSYLKNPYARPINPAQPAALPPGNAEAIAAFVENKPALTLQVMRELGALFGARSIDASFARRITAGGLSCIYRAVDLEGLKRAEYTYASTTMRADLEQLRAINRYLKTEASGEPQKALVASRAYIDLLDAGKPFNEVVNRDEWRAPTPEQIAARNHRDAERIAFLGTPAGRALVHYEMQGAPWYRRAPKVYLYQAFEKCSADYDTVFAR